MFAYLLQHALQCALQAAHSRRAYAVVKTAAGIADCVRCIDMEVGHECAERATELRHHLDIICERLDPETLESEVATTMSLAQGLLKHMWGVLWTNFAYARGIEEL